MAEPVVSISLIEKKAKAAANSGQQESVANPYPPCSAAGRLFKHAFIETLHGAFQAALENKRNSEPALMQSAQAAMKEVA